MEVVLLRQEVNTERWDTSQEWFIQRRCSLVLIAPSCFSRGNGSQDFVHVRQTVHHGSMGWTLSYIFNSLVSAAPSTQSPNQQVLSDIRICEPSSLPRMFPLLMPVWLVYPLWGLLLYECLPCCKDKTHDQQSLQKSLFWLLVPEG